MKKIVIYSQEGCSHCAELKNLLEQNGIPYLVSDIDRKKEDWQSNFRKYRECICTPSFNS